MSATTLSRHFRREERSVVNALRLSQKSGLVRIRYAPECVYSLTNAGYEACERFDFQEYPSG